MPHLGFFSQEIPKKGFQVVEAQRLKPRFFAGNTSELGLPEKTYRSNRDFSREDESTDIEFSENLYALAIKNITDTDSHANKIQFLRKYGHLSNIEYARVSTRTPKDFLTRLLINGEEIYKECFFGTSLKDMEVDLAFIKILLLTIYLCDSRAGSKDKLFAELSIIHNYASNHEFRTFIEIFYSIVRLNGKDTYKEGIKILIDYYINRSHYQWQDSDALLGPHITLQESGRGYEFALSGKNLRNQLAAYVIFKRMSGNLIKICQFCNCFYFPKDARGIGGKFCSTSCRVGGNKRGS